jgi:hypothetical protein
MSVRPPRPTRLALLVATLLGIPGVVARPLAAQETAPTAATASTIDAATVGAIVNAVLATVLHPESSLSRVPIAQRRLRFDHARTMAAFGLPDTLTVTLTDPRLRAITTPGSRDLLADCDQGGSKPCRRLGWNAYVWVAPIALDAAQAHVVAHVGWATHMGGPFEEGVAPRGRAFFTGFGAEVHLVRARDGRWRFDRFGRAVAGE